MQPTRKSQKHAGQREYREYREPDADDESSLGILNVDDMDSLNDIRGSLPSSRPNVTHQQHKSYSSSDIQRPRNHDSLNISSLLENDTIHARLTPKPTTKRSENLFEPSEITGRSTELSTVEEILAESCSEEVREMGRQLAEMKVRHSSYSARTADMSLASTYSSSKSEFDWGAGAKYEQRSAMDTQLFNDDDEVFSGSRVESILKEGERSWNAENATIPNESLDIDDLVSMKSTATYNVNPSQFSENTDESSRSNRHKTNRTLAQGSDGEYSMGEFFSRRCDDIRQILPALSPKKKHKIVGLLQQSTLSPPEKDLPEEEHSIRSTSDRNRLSDKLSVMSVSEIAAYLEKREDSPRTVASKLLRHSPTKKQLLPAVTPAPQYEPEPSTIEPLADILYITQPLPLNTVSTNSKASGNVKILKYEKYYGPSSDLIKTDANLKLGPVANRLKNQFTELTPTRQHIVKAPKYRQDNQTAQLGPISSKENKENIPLPVGRNELSETLSYTESMWEHSGMDSDAGMPEPWTAKPILQQLENSQQPNPELTLHPPLPPPPPPVETSASDTNYESSAHSKPTRDKGYDHPSRSHSRDECATTNKSDIQKVPESEHHQPQLRSPQSNQKRTRQSPTSSSQQGHAIDIIYESPPRPKQIPNHDKVFVLQSKSRLHGVYENEYNKRSGLHAVPETGYQALRTPSPTNIKEFFPNSSPAVSPRYCSSSKLELASPRSEADAGGGGRRRASAFRLHGRTRSRSMSPTLLTHSQCSGSSNDLLSTEYKNEISALKSSHAELSWESVKLRKNSSKTFTIKNSSVRKLSLKMEIIGPGFQISGTDLSCLVHLQAHECRTITVIFCPTMIGLAIGYVCFHSTRDIDGHNVRKVKLFGYGGNTLVQVQGVGRGPIGSPFLNLGCMRDATHSLPIRKTFVIYNRGPLYGMVVVRVKSATQKGLESSSISLQPSKCVIPPDSYQQIYVTFQPRRSDLKKLLKKQAPVITIATLEVIYGDEPNRQRICRLVDQLKQQSNMYHPLDVLFSQFPNERLIDFGGFDEGTMHVDKLFGAFKTEEIALTLNHFTMNETVDSEPDLMVTGLDETMMFRTLMADTTSVSAAGGPAATIQKTQSDLTPMRPPIDFTKRSWSVKPLYLQLNPFGVNNMQTITIISNLATTQTFELVANYRQLVECRPDCGTIRPGEEVLIHVKIRSVELPSDDIYLSVYIENDKIDVLLDVHREQLRPARR